MMDKNFDVIDSWPGCYLVEELEEEMEGEKGRSMGTVPIKGWMRLLIIQSRKSPHPQLLSLPLVRHKHVSAYSNLLARLNKAGETDESEMLKPSSIYLISTYLSLYTCPVAFHSFFHFTG